MVREEAKRPIAIYIEAKAGTNAGSKQIFTFFDSGSDVNLVSAMAAKKWS
jgi:Reverse transcriptase (RNA-dependent DNA polymerase)